MRTWAINRAAGALLASLLCLALLTACAPLLEQTYTNVEPHSSRFWDSESQDVLRAENYQDIVNDLLLLIAQHTESGTLRLYGFRDDQPVSDLMEQAGVEIQQETPLGAYAVEYLTSAVQSQRGFYEAAVQIGYRRTAEQIQGLVNATRPEAIYSLLESALEAGKTEIAVRVSYWGASGRARVEESVIQLREARGLGEASPWLVNYYPPGEEVGLVEFLLDPAPELLQEPLAENVSLFLGPPEAVETSGEEAELPGGPEAPPGEDAEPGSLPEPPQAP